MRWAVPCSLGGTGQTEQQVQAMAELRPADYIGTPASQADSGKKPLNCASPLPSVTKALLSGEAFPPSLRDSAGRARRGGLPVLRHRRSGPDRLRNCVPARALVLDEGVIVEIVRPGTGDPVPEGEVGELVVTTLNPDYPLIRFGTGDLSAILPGHRL